MGWRDSAQLPTPTLPTVSTWRLILATGLGTKDSLPVARFGHAAVLLGVSGGDGTAHLRMVVLGGQSATRLLNDVWALSLEDCIAEDGAQLARYTWRKMVAYSTLQ